MSTNENITVLLQYLNEGQDGALNALMTAVNDDLRRLAKRHLERHFGPGLPGATLQPTALVNESFLRLIKQRSKYDNRGHFFAVATRILIRVLLDYERERSAAKRGGHWVQVPLDPERDSPRSPHESPTSMVALADCLEALERLDARKAEVVKLRVLWGLTLEEIAKTLKVARVTVARDWAFAKAWLADELG